MVRPHKAITKMKFNFELILILLQNGYSIGEETNL